MRAGQNLDNGSRVVSLKHFHCSRVDRLLEAQFDIILAVEAFRSASERRGRAGTLFPPRPVSSEKSRLSEVP